MSFYVPIDTAGKCRYFIVGFFFLCGFPNCIYILTSSLSRVPYWSSLMLFAYFNNTIMGFFFYCFLLFQVPGMNLLLQCFNQAIILLRVLVRYIIIYTRLPLFECPVALPTHDRLSIPVIGLPTAFYIITHVLWAPHFTPCTFTCYFFQR
jgi:hypothetical protein